jgi:hypothetical protein
MPFELGLAVSHAKSSARTTWFVLEAKAHRLSKSLSDLAGTDPYIHGGKPHGVFREICNCLVREQRQPAVAEIATIYRGLKKIVPAILVGAGSQSLFAARVFHDLILAAQTLTVNTLGRK